MKLVTLREPRRNGESRDFNPHEREARDGGRAGRSRSQRDFNPHEREARDDGLRYDVEAFCILIHTSVKLVTILAYAYARYSSILIHTSVKLVTALKRRTARSILF